MSSDKQEQFSRIYDQYINPIYRFVYLKVSSHEVAQDVTSQVFLRGWQAYQKEKVIDNPKAFLYQIARNSVIDHYRKQGKEKTVSVDNVPQLTDPRTNSQDMAILNADMELVKGAIAKLKKDYQDIIIWYYIEGMPPEEIAGLIQRPVGTVRVMIHRGLEALKGQLHQEA